MEQNDNVNKKSYLSFSLENEIFAIDVHKVLEVLEYQKVTQVPKTPDYIRGVVNFRGDILPVIDTRLKFNMAKTESTKKTVIIVLNLKIKEKKMVIGALADSVKDVLAIEEKKIKIVPELGSRYNTEFIEGMVKTEEGFIMILNIDKVFSVDELNILKETTDEV